MSVASETRRAGLLRRPYVLATVGAWSLVFLAAFESLAVTTIMPVVTADLDGRGLYALAFSSTLAAGVVGMVAIGSWADRRGPAVPLFTAIAVFTAGLAVAGTATAMPVFVAGRFLQGLGAGGLTVALYVLVAMVYPAALHIRIFGAFSSAWVLPSMVGPFVAGFVADTLSWHWVFLGVVVLVAVAGALILPAVRGRDRAPADRVPASAADARRVAEAAVVAVGVVALSSLGELEPAAAWLLAPVPVVVIGFALRDLVPPGTYRIRAGLPATVVLCGAAGGVFFGTDVYLPLLLHDRYGLPAWLSGITLTAGAIAWALASVVQGRLGDRLDPGTAIRAGAALLTGGAALELATVVLHLHPGVAAAGWFVAGGGMGTLYPRISALVLALSAPGEEGFNTAAKSITEAVGGSAALAVSGLLFSLVPFVGPFVFTTALGVVTVLIGLRVAASR
ncbi:MFS transporter [Actinoplanes sp. ATCC 53533]|uniref:MFS transporter n=1 Tax=Actinoplanes sp. ATCC 53533 TaxID=1288362 RepID=UPI000F788FF4|nr:MFS transporter [Actinoplanes sp. ATCC 53533]RSM45592.1 MFS transporter [Actinoplanes sp. ATCC 53533]